MGILRFKAIKALQKAQDLSVNLYHHFCNLMDNGFQNQISRASVSISNNIAEGFERKSKTDFSRFLNYALASNGEVRSMLYLASKLKYINEKIAKELIENANEISRIINGLKKLLR